MYTNVDSCTSETSMFYANETSTIKNPQGVLLLFHLYPSFHGPLLIKYMAGEMQLFSGSWLSPDHVNHILAEVYWIWTIPRASGPFPGVKTIKVLTHLRRHCYGLLTLQVRELRPGVGRTHHRAKKGGEMWPRATGWGFRALPGKCWQRQLKAQWNFQEYKKKPQAEAQTSIFSFWSWPPVMSWVSMAQLLGELSLKLDDSCSNA